jgi:hypothetical protein
MGTTILAANTDNRDSSATVFSPDCFSMGDAHPFTSFGGNLLGIKNANCNFSENNQLVGTPTNSVDPRLGPLNENGGATKTHALLDAPNRSPAVDKGIVTPLPAGHPLAYFFGCPDRDQRSYTRQVDGDNDGNGFCDIGAYELRAVPNPAPRPSPPPEAPRNVTIQ